MVSFSCEVCNDTLAKKKLDQHRNQCRGATFTCLDCMTHFHGTDYRSHTSCISEAQKYQGHLYRDKKNKTDKRKSINGTEDLGDNMVPRKAYVEDAPEDESQALAIVDVPPRAPTPPPAEPPQNVNVFDFLVPEGTTHQLDGIREIEPSAQFMNGAPPLPQHHFDSRAYYTEHGFSYGQSPVYPSFGRYDSWQTLTESQPTQALLPPPPFVTPAPKAHKKEKREKQSTDKKRKRQIVEELDLSTTKRSAPRDEPMSDAPIHASGGRVLHSGLTGGLSKLVTDVDFYNDRIAAGPTPISPIKRSKRGDHASLKNDRRKSSYVSYSTTTSKGESSNKHSAPRSRSQDRESSTHRERRHRHHHRRQESLSSEDHSLRPSSRNKHLKAIEYPHPPPQRPGSVQPHANNQLVSYRARANHFLSFIKGPDSQHGCSINKILKRYHRERDVHGDERDDDDKELWKSLRLRKNDRGEIVLFVD